jgi:hypothetical protein
VTIDGCGHVPQVERADETNELLLSFFARADAAAPDVPAGHRAGAEAA